MLPTANDVDFRHTIASTFAEKSIPQTLPQSCAELGNIFIEGKGIVPFFN
jgi:hypothetical protein